MPPYEERIPTTTCTLKEKVIGVDENVETDCKVNTKKNGINSNEVEKAEVEYVPQIKWPDLLAQAFIHFGCVYGFYLCLTQAKALTFLWGEKLQFYYFNMLLIIYFNHNFLI